ncbi:MAG: hypothetical protein ABI977_11525 [Acidobacteriota bacterium]
MRCPKCQTNVPDSHFYCPNCHASVYGYIPEGAKANGGGLERAGRRLLDLFLILLLIGGGIVLGRAIKWKELLNSVNPSAEVSPSVKSGPALPGHSSKRRAANPSSQSPSEAPGKSATETVPAAKPKTEEPSSKSEIQPTAKPTVTPTPRPNSQ